MKKTFKKAFLTATLLGLSVFGLNQVNADPVKVIFDTDMAEDVDDVGALGILNAMADAGEVEILACGISAPNEYAGPTVDAINTFYGRSDIPIGQPRNFKKDYPNPDKKYVTPTNYGHKIAENFPHDLIRTGEAEDAVQLYRRVLAAQPDHSVKIITVGFLTNLENLLNSQPDQYSKLTGEKLVAQKVSQWVCMGGGFPGPAYEYNLMMDTTASVRVINDWPTPVVFSGFEIGQKVFAGNALAAKPETWPTRMGYQWYWKGKENLNRESWDLTTVLYAVRGEQDYWDLSEPGKCLMHFGIPRGQNEWIPYEKGNHRYLIQKMDPVKLGAVLDELLTRTPKIQLEQKAKMDTSRAAGFVELFDGTMNGWTVTTENSGSWKLVDGCLYTDGPRAHLFYSGPVCDATFRNYTLHIEAKSMAGANSGVFINTKYQESGWPKAGYEIQLNNSMPRNGNNYEHKKTGSIYNVRNNYKQIVGDGEWYNMDITVQGAHVIVEVNGIKISDYVEPKSAAILSPGTIALQCHDPKSHTYFRRIAIKPLLAQDVKYAEEPTEHQKALNKISSTTFPLVDMHTHLKGGLTTDDLIQRTYDSGVNFGIAANCGMKFGITNDAGALQFIKTMKGKPFFVGMQAEGREWVDMFSPEVRAQFDYILTDSMTFSNNDGVRMRLWIPEETVIADPQEFMEMLVDRIEGIMAEPIDIYANSTYLPDALMKDYDALWTDERMDRVINAAKKNGVAVEINDAYNIPSAKFIKKAKAAGVKFTFGTNNGDPNFGDHLEYALKMIKECDLQPSDMWVPGKFPRRSY